MAVSLSVVIHVLHPTSKRMLCFVLAALLKEKKHQCIFKLCKIVTIELESLKNCTQLVSYIKS